MMHKLLQYSLPVEICFLLSKRTLMAGKRTHVAWSEKFKIEWHGVKSIESHGMELRV
jgi:hypothetical protein